MSKLYASAARRNISPSKEMIALWNKKAAKPYSPLVNEVYIAALVFSNMEEGAKRQTLIHICGDIASTFGGSFRDEICKEFNVPQSCVFYSSTHNHMVPPAVAGNLGPGANAGEGVIEWTEIVANLAKEAVRSAMATLRHARIGAGHGISGIGVNREWDTPVGSLGTGDRNGETLNEISVLRVDETNGKPIAVMVNSNCHAGSFYGGAVSINHRITGGDVAGLVSEFVGNAIGNGVVPIWAIGGAGDQNTYFHSGMMWPSVDDKGEFYLETYIMKDPDLIKLGRNTAAIQCMEALKVYNNITEFSTGFELKSGITYKKVPRVRTTTSGAPASAAQNSDTTFRFYLITLNGIAFAGANTESFIGLKKAVRGVLQAYDEKFWIDMNLDATGNAGYVPSPRYDSNYGGGMRNGLTGTLLANNGNDVIRAYADGFEELLKTIA